MEIKNEKLYRGAKKEKSIGDDFFLILLFFAYLLKSGIK